MVSGRLPTLGGILDRLTRLMHVTADAADGVGAAGEASDGRKDES